MSLALTMGTEPHGLNVKTFGLGEDTVCIGEYRLSMYDFVEMVKYVVTNTNLQPDDPRFDLVTFIRKLKLAQGFNGDSARYKASGAPAGGGAEGVSRE